MSYDASMQADQTTSLRIQELLAGAEHLLEQAANLADEIGIELVFRGQRYRPAQTIPGSWFNDSEPEWNPSADMSC